MTTPSSRPKNLTYRNGDNDCVAKDSQLLPPSRVASSTAYGQVRRSIDLPTGDPADFIGEQANAAQRRRRAGFDQRPRLAAVGRAPQRAMIADGPTVAGADELDIVQRGVIPPAGPAIRGTRL